MCPKNGLQIRISSVHASSSTQIGAFGPETTVQHSCPISLHSRILSTRASSSAEMRHFWLEGTVKQGVSTYARPSACHLWSDAAMKMA